MLEAVVNLLQYCSRFGRPRIYTPRLPAQLHMRVLAINDVDLHFQTGELVLYLA